MVPESSSFPQPLRLTALGGSGATAGLDRVADHIRTFEATVPADASLKAAFAEMLQHDAGWVAVLDGERYLGVLTPDTLHAALRRSVGGEPVIV